MKKRLFAICLSALLLLVSCRDTEPLHPVTCENTEDGNIFIIKNITSDINRINFFRDGNFIGNIFFTEENPDKPETLTYNDCYYELGKEYNYQVNILDKNWKIIEFYKFKLTPDKGHGEADISAPQVTFTVNNSNSVTGTVTKKTQWRNRWVPSGYSWCDIYSSYDSNENWIAEKSVSADETTFYIKSSNGVNAGYIMWSKQICKQDKTYSYNVNLFTPSVRLGIPSDALVFDYDSLKNPAAGFGYRYNKTYDVTTIRLWGESGDYPALWKIYRDVPDELSAKLKTLYDQWLEIYMTGTNDQRYEVRIQILDVIKQLENLNK